MGSQYMRMNLLQFLRIAIGNFIMLETGAAKIAFRYLKVYAIN